MTDKQIIIDGVDISGCECYTPNIKMDCLMYPLQSDACKNSPNCYYKQLKAKEQECEELKETIDDFISDNSFLYSYDGKQPSDLYELQECMQSSMNEFVKYKQTLDEIEEFCIVYSDNHDAYENVYKHILEIINEAKDGE